MDLTNPKLVEWMNQMRTEIDKSGSLICPACNQKTSLQFLRNNKCQSCNLPFTQGIKNRHLTKTTASLVAAIALVGVGIVFVIGFFKYVLPVVGTMFPGNKAATVVVTIIAFGILPVAMKDIIKLIVNLPFKSGAEESLKRVAQKFEEKGDEKNAARYYAELLTCTFERRDNRDVFCFWEKSQKDAVSFHAEFRDLLFLDRLLAYAYWFNRFKEVETEDSRNLCIKNQMQAQNDIAVLADENPRQLALAEAVSVSWQNFNFGVHAIVNGFKNKSPELAKRFLDQTVRVRPA